MEKLLFFCATTARLGKYRMGSYGRIGVYRKTLYNLEVKGILQMMSKSLYYHWQPTG